MTRKKTVSYTLPDCKIDLLNKISERVGLNRSNTLEMLLDIVDLYFTDEQLDMEASVYKPTDMRRKDQGE